MQRGVPSTFLIEERISQLRNVGFEFSLKNGKVVPVLDWSSRIQQLEAFHSEMGHMVSLGDLSFSSVLARMCKHNNSSIFSLWSEG